jgi:hypothetical protein
MTVSNKVNFILILFLTVITLNTVFGQQSVLEQRVTIEVNNVTIAEALNMLSKKENISLSYKSDLEGMQNNISISVNNEPF